MGKKDKRSMPVKGKAPTAKAVGVVSYSPNVLVIFGAYSSRPDEDSIFAFPPTDGKEFSIPKSTGGRNYVMVLAPDKLADLAPHASMIHRLLVFTDPVKAQAMGLPIIDAVVKDGKIEKELTHRADELRSKIESLAVDLPLVAPVLKKKRAVEVKPFSLLDRLRSLTKAFKGDKVEFENTIMIPTMLRLVREIKKEEFGAACKRLRKFGVPLKLTKQFRRYVDEQTESGNTLGRAARVYLSSKNKGKRHTPEDLAKKYKCELHDLRLVVLSVTRLVENLAT